MPPLAAGEPFSARLGRFCRYVLPLFLWMAFIFAMSTSLGASDNTQPLVERILGRLWPEALARLSPEQFGLLNFLVRKAAHVFEYAVLTILAVRAFQQDRIGWRWRSGLGAVALSLLYASSDEWHQKFVADRTGTIVDVGVDAIGVFLALLLCWLWYRGNRNLPAELARLSALRERGALTEAEFRTAKARVLRAGAILALCVAVSGGANAGRLENPHVRITTDPTRGGAVTAMSYRKAVRENPALLSISCSYLGVSRTSDLYISAGPPCRVPYVRYALAEER